MKFSLDLKAKGASQMTGNPKVIVVKIEVLLYLRKNLLLLYIYYIYYIKCIL